jgi:hypothetical protein
VKEGAPLAGIELTQPLTQHRRRKMALETELRYFGEHKEEWLKHYEGKYALVKGETLVGTFTTFQEAYQRGIAGLSEKSPSQRYRPYTHGWAKCPHILSTIFPLTLLLIRPNRFKHYKIRDRGFLWKFTFLMLWLSTMPSSRCPFRSLRRDGRLSIREPQFLRLTNRPCSRWVSSPSLPCRYKPQVARQRNLLIR